MALVYQHRRNDTNEVFYIGISKNIKRPYDSQRRNKIWKNVANKSGFSVDILINGCSLPEAYEVEKGLIKAYGRRGIRTGILTNRTDGGEGASNTDRSKEIRDKISAGMKGKNNWMTGKKHTEVTKAKMRKSSKHLPHTPEMKKHLSDCKKGDKCYMFGNVPYNTKPVININTGESFRSAKHAAISQKIPVTTFYRWLRGGKKDYSFKYQ